VFTICNDMTVQVWDANTGRALTGPINYANEADLEGYHSQVGAYRGERSAIFSADGKMVAMAFGGRPLLLDGYTARIITEPIKHEIVRSAEFSRDNQRIVTASLEGAARIWGVRDGRQWPIASDDRAKSGFAPVPDWVPVLLEALAEMHLNDQGVVETARPLELSTLTRQLFESPGSDAWTRWGKWLFGGSLPAASRAASANGQSKQAAAPSQLSKDLIGIWVHVGRPGNTSQPPAKGGRYKFRTGSNWTLTRADADTGEVVEHFGGTYTLNGNEYVETQEYADATWVRDNGKSFKFTVKVEGDVMTQIGIGNPYNEVWKRVESAEP